MVPYDKVMINKLLDSYEASLLSVGENVRTINIEMRFIKKNIPAYFDESTEEYEQIHIWAKRLEEMGLIFIIWKGKKIGHIIEKIRLNTDNVTAAYKYVKRVSKRNSEEDTAHMLQEYMRKVNTSVCRKFIAFLLQRIEKHESVKEYIHLGDLDYTKKLLTVIQCIEENTEQLYIREFSIKTMNDSKAFEKIQNKVTSIFKRFHSDYQGMELSEILAEYSIYHTPNYVYFKGMGVISIGDDKVDLSVLKQGVGISGEDIDRIQVVSLQKIEKVITIENLTTFFRYSEANSLVVYLGGYHNTNRRKLLKNIYQRIPNVKYYHFGDIDAGGYRIFYDLKEKTGIPFVMLHMDLKTLTEFEAYGKPLTNEDRKRLKDMLDNEEISKEVKYMLENNVKLEQECILV